MSEIKKKSMVTLTYDLHIDDKNGELIEKATEEKPLQFIYGIGMMLPKFEENITQYKEGDSYSIHLKAAEAYGEVMDDAIVDLPKDVFIVDGKFDDELIKKGNAVPMMSTNGQKLNGIVLDVTDENVKMDFNHPLAGEDLFFEGKVKEVRDATEEEIAAITNGGGGCGDSCGCGDSLDHSCGDGGCGDGSCGDGGCC